MSDVPRYWTPLTKTDILQPPSEELIRVTQAHYKVDRNEAVALLQADRAKCEYWVNRHYQVEVRRHDGGLVHLNIRRRDGAALMRDWRHFQQIKNEIVGPECEAIELYPAESRKVDTSNKFHLWAIADPTFRFPIGFEERQVDYSVSDCPGMRQRTL